MISLYMLIVTAIGRAANDGQISFRLLYAPLVLLLFLGNARTRGFARSSIEAEYQSLRMPPAKYHGLYLFFALSMCQFKPVPIHVDNQSSIQLAKNHVYYARTKHVEIDCHFIRDKIQSNFINPTYIHTSSQLANLFTKLLGRFLTGSSYPSLVSTILACHQLVVSSTSSPYATSHPHTAIKMYLSKCYQTVAGQTQVNWS